jgi:hypothetical protein
VPFQNIRPRINIFSKAIAKVYSDLYNAGEKTHFKRNDFASIADGIRKKLHPGHCGVSYSQKIWGRPIKKMKIIKSVFDD